MKLYFNKPEKTIKIIEWVRENADIWEMIITPNNEEITKEKMAELINLFCEQDMGEMIFFMIYAQKEKMFVKDMMTEIALYYMATKWDNEKPCIIRRMRRFLNK